MRPSVIYKNNSNKNARMEFTVIKGSNVQSFDCAVISDLDQISL